MTVLMPRKSTKKKEHYVDNKKFLHELIIYRNKIAQAAEAGDPKPRVTNYIGECFLKIATHLSNPFAYFTQIVYYAYLRRIAKEKRQQAIREKILERKGFEEVFHSDTNDNHSDMNYIKSRVESNTRYG